jgi:hypothetical protein
MIYCSKCGHEMLDESLFCSKCGTKVETNDSDIKIELINEVDRNDITSIESISSKESSDLIVEVPKKSNKKSLIITSVIILIICLGAGSWYYNYNKDQKEKREAALHEQKKQNYENDLKTVVKEMLDLSGESESMINTYSKLWSDIIQSDYSSRVEIDGKKIYDFNTGLQLQMKKFEADGSIQKLTDGKLSTSEKMKLLNDPLEEYKTSYEIAFQMYGSFNEYISLATNPSGSLTSFNAKTSELSSEIIKKISDFQIRLPLK